MLSVDRIQEVRRLLSQPELSQRTIARMTGVSRATIGAVASGRRPASDVGALLLAADNSDVSPPAPPHALFLDRVVYPRELYAEAS